MFKHRLLASIMFTSLATPSLAAEPTTEIRSTLQDQQEIAVTIYNDNLALVKDQRKVNLLSGLNHLALRDVSAQIRPETALLHSLTSPDSLSILEQNFDFDLLTPQKLLEKYVGRTVSIMRMNPATGVETTEQAQVLSVNNGVVFRIGDHIETGIPGRIIYEDVPANLRDRPTLVVQLQNKTAAEQLLELSYLTSGLSWKADYVAELNANEEQLDLSGWITLTNTSGTRYQDAKLQLVAGDVNIIREQRAAAMESMRMKTMAMDAAAPVAEESLFEYHLYTLNRKTTLAENQTKQVALLNATGIPARKELILQGAEYYYQSNYGELGQKIKVDTYVEFENRQNSGLGTPLPKGILRVYKKDTAGNAQFIGEDSIDHTPKNEKVRLKLGAAFDVTADKKQTDFKKLPNPEKGTSLYESAYEIVIKNAKSEPVTIKVREPIPGDWKMLRSSHPQRKAASNTAEWQITIPAEGQTTLTYRVQVRY